MAYDLCTCVWLHTCMSFSASSIVCSLIHRVVCLESRPTNDQTAHSSLYVLAGHENTYWLLQNFFLCVCVTVISITLRDVELPVVRVPQTIIQLRSSVRVDCVNVFSSSPPSSQNYWYFYGQCCHLAVLYEVEALRQPSGVKCHSCLDILLCLLRDSMSVSMLLC